MTKRAKWTLFGCLAVLLAAALAAGILLSGRFVWAAGALRAKNSRMLDLRGKVVSLADVQALQQKLPQCRVLWNATVGGEQHSSDDVSLRVDHPTEEDWANLEQFSDLRALRANGVTDLEALRRFRQSHPECQVLGSLILDGTEYPDNAREIALSTAQADMLDAVLIMLQGVKQVTLTGGVPSRETLQNLLEAYPDISFCWEEAGVFIESGSDTLNLGEVHCSVDQIRAWIALLPNLQRVEMGASSLAIPELAALSQEFPEILFFQEVDVQGHAIANDCLELDLSGIPLTKAEVEKLLPCFPIAERVIMIGCGLDDETMDSLNHEYEGIRFIWTVRIKNVEIRTDTKWFYPFKYQKNMVVVEEDLYPLRYCVDIEAIDIGHMTQVKTMEWARYMPNLKYLVIAECAITDLSPLEGLEHLVFLEIFTTPITDYSPLLKCPALEDLNLGNTYGDPAPIAQMTWLKHLWWSGIYGSYGRACSKAPEMLPKALPNTIMKFNLMTPNVDNGWRQLDNYYAMRDLMDVFYLT